MTPKAFYHNGQVAWYIGDDRIASLYLLGYYVPADGWQISKRETIKGRKVDPWYPGKHGELRKERG